MTCGIPHTEHFDLHGSDCLTRVLMIHTHVLPRSLYGLEVVTPACSTDWAVVRRLDQLVHDALHEAFGMAVGSDAWHVPHCVRGDIPFPDSRCYQVSDAIDAAHLCFPANLLLACPRLAADGDASVGLTTTLRATLPVDQPLRAHVNQAAARLLPDTEVALPEAAAR